MVGGRATVVEGTDTAGTVINYGSNVGAAGRRHQRSHYSPFSNNLKKKYSWQYEVLYLSGFVAAIDFNILNFKFKLYRMVLPECRNQPLVA